MTDSRDEHNSQVLAAEDIAPLRWGAWVVGRPRRGAVGCVVAIAILRAGIGLYGRWPGFKAASADLLRISENLPSPTDHAFGMTVVSPAIARMLDITTIDQWLVLHAFIVAAVLYMVVRLLIARMPAGHSPLLALAAFLASGLFVSVLNMIGHYDVWMLLAAALIVLPSQWYWSLPGGLLMGFTNAEQTLVALCGLTLCALALDRGMAKRAGLAAASALIAKALVTIWFRRSGIEATSRADLLGPNLAMSVRGFAGNWGLFVYTWFSAAWVIVLTCLARLRGLALGCVIAGLILLPAAASITTTDGTRVFATTSAPAFLLVICWLIHEVRERRGFELRLTSMLVTVMILTPGLSTWVNGSIQRPWDSIYVQLRS